jgi:hypothetical protein
MGEDGSFCPLAGGATVGNPFDLSRGIVKLENNFIGRWLYSPVLAYNLAYIFSK